MKLIKCTVHQCRHRTLKNKPVLNVWHKEKKDTCASERAQRRFDDVMKPAVLPCAPVGSWRRIPGKLHRPHLPGSSRSLRRGQAAAWTHSRCSWRHRDQSAVVTWINRLWETGCLLKIIVCFSVNSFEQLLCHSYHLWDEWGSNLPGQEVVPVDRCKHWMFLQLHLGTQPR